MDSSHTLLFHFLRSGEVCIPADCSFDEGAHLAFADVSVDSIRIRIKASKTGPFRQGVDIFVGRTGEVLWPVSVILTYLVARGNHLGPLFMFQDGKLLTRPRFVSDTQGALSMTGIDPSPYSGDSFRSGAATTAAAKGISDTTIKMLGQWKSSAYQVYIKMSPSQLAAISTQLAGGK